MVQLQSIDGHQWQQQQQPNNSSPLHSQQQHHAPQQQQQIIESRLRLHLEATGEMDRIKRELHARLAECGWRDALRERAKELIRHRGLTNVTVDELASELIPAGRASVPSEIRGVALDRVRAALGDDGGAPAP